MSQASVRDPAEAVSIEINWEAIINEIVQVAESAASESLVPEVFTGAGETIGVAEAMAGSMGRIMVMPVYMSGLMLCSLGYRLRSIVMGVAGKVPLVGNGLAGWVAGAFRPLDQLRASTVDALVGGSQELVPDMLGVGRGIVGATVHNTAHGRTVVYKADNAAVRNEINRLQGQINTLSQRVTNLEHSVHAGPTPVHVDVTPLTHVINQALADVQVLYHNQLLMQREIQTLRGDSVQTSRAIEQLQHQTASIHSVEVTITDIVNQAQSAITQLQRSDARQTATIQQNRAGLTRMAPLELLLQPGMRGLRNLRKLEDDPCQCPKFRGVGNELGTALAILEFVENG